MEKMIYRDVYFESFGTGDQDEFLQAIADYNETVEWFAEEGKGLKITLADEGDLSHIDTIAKMQAHTDTVENTGLCVDTEKGLIPIGSSAMASLFQRCRISGSALRDMPTDHLRSVLNHCLPVSKGNTLIRIAGDKCRALLGGDENDYSIIETREIFSEAEKEIKKYEKARFKEGSIDHTITTALWEIEDSQLENAYYSVFGFDTNKRIKARVRVVTSDVGASGANIYYGFTAGGQKVFCGLPLKLEHSHKNSIEDFKNNLRSIFPRFKESLVELKNLENIWIRHPADCMKAVMLKKRFGAKVIAQCLEWHEINNGGMDPCNALDLYYSICHAAELADQNNSRAIAEVEERISSCITMNWKDYDYVL